MSNRLLVVVDSALGADVTAVEGYLAGLSDALQEEVLFAEVATSRMNGVRAAVLTSGGLRSQAAFRPKPPVSNAPMGSAPFVYLDDGRPDWSSMWQGFCELALFGGPPHRGEDSALRAPAQPGNAPQSEYDAIGEIRRGIRETTGLEAGPAEPGWISVACESPKMAAWLCATILLENVEARCDGTQLLLPASPDFELKDQVKSVITVLAKTHHYWQAHVEKTAAAAVS
ncbi:MAG: sirohydrochlorin cobaltochelatase [Chloroflexota bacterium]|jgi:sirohydrochlorin cobaltochelatase|nr:sirohydrochlorin cobaltochelatase [Chloroflexota bacterium]